MLWKQPCKTQMGRHIFLQGCNYGSRAHEGAQNIEKKKAECFYMFLLFSRVASQILALWSFPQQWKGGISAASL